MRGIFNRTELLLGRDLMEIVARKRVIIFGVGGVGSWCAESLVRSGIGRLTIVDSDRVCVTNVNRQLMATCRTIGRVKVEALRERLLEINPTAQIEAVQEIYSMKTAMSFHLEDYDYIVDCIDSLKNKADLLLTATRHGATVFSSMGAAQKMDPTLIRVAEFWKVRGCPLGAALRKKMRHIGMKPQKPILCVYSEELLENRGSDDGERIESSIDVACEDTAAGRSRLADVKATSPGREDLQSHDWCSSKAQINGTVAHVTAIFGFTLAGLVMQDIVRQRPGEA